MAQNSLKKCFNLLEYIAEILFIMLSIFIVFTVLFIASVLAELCQSFQRINFHFQILICLFVLSYISLVSVPFFIISFLLSSLVLLCSSFLLPSYISIYILKIMNFHLNTAVVVVQSPTHVQLFKIPWTAAPQASLSLTITHSLPKFTSMVSGMPSNHLILCCPLLLLPQSFLASGSFPMSWLFTPGGQRIELQLQHQSFQ